MSSKCVLWLHPHIYPCSLSCLTSITLTKLQLEFKTERSKTLVLALLRKQNIKSPVRVRALHTVQAPSVKSLTDQQELSKLWPGTRPFSGALRALQWIWNALYPTTLQALGNAQQHQLLSDTQHLPRALLHNYHQSHQHCLEDLVHSMKK